MDMAKIKTNIKKFFSNPNTLTFLLILGLIIVIYVIYSYMITAAIKPSTLPYATQTIKEKSEIKSISVFITIPEEKTYTKRI